MSFILKEWIVNNHLNVKWLNDKVFEIIGKGKFLLIEPKDYKSINDDVFKDKIFDNEFQVMLTDSENALADNVDFIVFLFGDKFYYCDSLVPDEILCFKYVGKPNLIFNDINLPHLGIHTGFELCNGSRLAKDWIKKAKFLNIDTLGICEENTLAGTLEFQEDCVKEKIKPVIGETVTILTDTKGKMNIKLYVQNETGWKNLLLINKIINVDNGGEYITQEQFWNRNTTGLICVLTPEVDLNKYWFNIEYLFEKIFFQIDFVEWAGNGKDEQWLRSLKNYFDNYLDVIEPILICDAYYIDKEDHHIKKTLNKIGKVGFKNNSKDQYFKSTDEIYMQATSLFKEDDARWELILDKAIDNANKICEGIEFKIPVGFFRLPKYEMNEEQKAKYANNDEWFFDLIQQGIEKKQIETDEYFERITEEVEVINEGGFIDYFLILNDLLSWCDSVGIWYGIGRGSAAGSLVSYLLNIVGIDPIKYGLLFSRFLNAGRLGKSLPDIDLDFQGERRDEVKRYMESKYGVDYVTAIGTYSTFKAKGAIKDLSREKGVDYNKTNYITSLLPKVEKPGEEINFTKLFKDYISKSYDFKKFTQKHYQIFEQLPLCLKQPKTASIHASGVVIVPKQYGNIYEQMPVKKIDGVLVSEWEGELIDKAGFLKCDILGVRQLDKIAAITDLIKQNTGKNVKFSDIPLEDEKVFELFRNGFTEDVFQFGTAGLKAYCKELKPDNINDLIAAVALYRPGTMDTGMHKKYVKIKHGVEKAIYDEGTFEATKETYGIAVYQEQVMQITKDVAGFDLVMADDVRKAMGKKDKELLDKQKEKFIEGGFKNGFHKEYLEDLWGKLETFSSYGFNKSHAASYAITGYFCQWFKVHYPVEFWTIALQYAKDEEIINRISEVSKISNIQISPVDINKSTLSFFADYDTHTIYWSITSVKWVGEKAVTEILNDRKENGEYFSLEEFCIRMKGKSNVNKRVIINLILAGAFDKTENINAKDRFLLLKNLINFTTHKLPEDLLISEKWKDYQWIMRQKELTGFGFINYENIVKSSSIFSAKHKQFKENGEILYSNIELGEYVTVCGVLKDVYTKEWKSGGSNKLAANLEIMDNEDTIRMCIWRDHFDAIKADLITAETKIIIISGKVAFDPYRNCNVIHSTTQTKIEVI